MFYLGVLTLLVLSISFIFIIKEFFTKSDGSAYEAVAYLIVIGINFCMLSYTIYTLGKF
jgi:hypothetical protein